MYAKYPLGQPLKICEFPFDTNNEDLVFTLILPNKDSASSIESQLNALFFDQLIGEMRPVTINTALPEFTIRHRVDIREILSKLGNMSDLFASSGCRDGLFVSHAYFESSISVGSRSASVEHRNTFLMSRQDIETKQDVKLSHVEEEEEGKEEQLVCYDNPFLFFIRNRRTKLILYLGKLVSPV